jgi:hypothetical protein
VGYDFSGPVQFWLFLQKKPGLWFSFGYFCLLEISKSTLVGLLSVYGGFQVWFWLFSVVGYQKPAVFSFSYFRLSANAVLARFMMVVDYLSLSVNRKH